MMRKTIKQCEEKSQKNDKSPFCRGAPAGPTLTKFGIGADPVDVVTCAKCDVSPLKGLDFGGSNFALCLYRKQHGPYNIAATNMLHVIYCNIFNVHGFFVSWPC